MGAIKFGITKAPAWGKAILKKFKKKSKSDFVKDETGTIVGVKPGSGKVHWYVGAGKTKEDRAKIGKTASKVKTIDAIEGAEKKISEGKKKLKHLRQTGWTHRIGKKEFPKAD